METRAIKGQLTKFVKVTMGSKNARLNGWYTGITNNEKRRKGEHSKINGNHLSMTIFLENNYSLCI